MDDTRRAEDRDPADNAKPRVPGFFRERCPARHRDFNGGIGSHAVIGSHIPNRTHHHLPWNGVDGRFAGRDRQPRLCHRADAFSRRERHTRAGGTRAHGRDNHRAMRDVRIVARILDDASPGKVLARFFQGKRESRGLALGQADRHGVWEIAGQERSEGGLGRRRRTCAGGPAASQRGLFLVLQSRHGIKRAPGLVLKRRSVS